LSTVFGTWIARLGDLVTSVGRIATAIVKKITDVVSAKNFDQSFVFRAVLIQSLQLVTRRAECPARRMAQRGYGMSALLARVDHVFSQCAYDAVTPRVNFTETVTIFACGLDNPAGARVDDGGNTTGLSIESILFGH
jgi:hypothetical protein